MVLFTLHTCKVTSQLFSLLSPAWGIGFKVNIMRLEIHLLIGPIHISCLESKCVSGKLLCLNDLIFYRQTRKQTL